MTPSDSPTASPSRWAWWFVLGLVAFHLAAAWFCLGGARGIFGPWPLALHDHPVAQHNAWISRSLLWRGGTTAGYDPYFLAGFGKSVLSSPSSSLFEVVALLSGGRNPFVVHKVLTWLILGLSPCLVVAIAAAFRLSPGGIASALGLISLYFWTNGGGGGFPLNYALFGMLAFLLGVPLGLLAVGVAGRYLRSGGRGAWLGSASLLAAAFLVHPTTALSLAPALAGLVLAQPRPFSRSATRRATMLLLAGFAAVAANGFWWLPALGLRSQSAGGGGFFTHAGSPWDRLAEIISDAPVIQALALGLGVHGLAVLARRDRGAAGGLGGFAAAGLFWGYLAGWSRSLDVLEPGRQTYALFTAAAVLGGVGLADLGGRVRDEAARGVRLAAAVGLAIVIFRLFGHDLSVSVRYRAGFLPVQPFLDSHAPPRLEAIGSWVRRTVKPGERLFYEESGLGLAGQSDPFDGRRYSGLLPRITGVEVIGGYHLHMAVRENFTQIGEGKLFGGAWTRPRFERYARLYRPSAILCWSRDARRFCRSNPDLIDLSFDDGRLLGGRVRGYGGGAIRGRATVRPEPGRVQVAGMVPDLDGLVVLRYHFLPGLRMTPPAELIPVRMEDDPVAFVAVRPRAGQTSGVLELSTLPGR